MESDTITKEKEQPSGRGHGLYRAAKDVETRVSRGSRVNNTCETKALRRKNTKQRTRGKVGGTKRALKRPAQKSSSQKKKKTKNGGHTVVLKNLTRDNRVTRREDNRYPVKGVGWSRWRGQRRKKSRFNLGGQGGVLGPEKSEMGPGGVNTFEPIVKAAGVSYGTKQKGTWTGEEG